MVRVEGAEQVVDFLNSRADAVETTVRKVLMDASMEAERLGKRRIHELGRIDTGRMQNEYQGMFVKRLEVSVFSPVPYWRFQEGGTIHITAMRVSEHVVALLPPIIERSATIHFREWADGR